MEQSKQWGISLTKQRDKKWIVVRHNDQIHSLTCWARLQVAKWTSDVIVFTAATYEYLTHTTNRQLI